MFGRLGWGEDLEVLEKRVVGNEAMSKKGLSEWSWYGYI